MFQLINWIETITYSDITFSFTTENKLIKKYQNKYASVLIFLLTLYASVTILIFDNNEAGSINRISYKNNLSRTNSYVQPNS